MLTLQSKLIALVVAVLIGVAAWGAHALEVSHLRTQIATLGRERDQAVAAAAALKLANADFVTQVASQNQQIDAMTADADAREKAAADAMAAVKALSARELAKAQNILIQPMAVPGNACASLDVLLSDAIKGRK
jgi:hypothetical protein